MTDAASWQACADSGDIGEKQMKEVNVLDKRLCLLRREGHVHAFSATCPHAGAPLCEGRIDPRGHIVCPLHGYRFNPANGYNSSGEGYKLKTYQTKEEEGRIFVQL